MSKTHIGEIAAAGFTVTPRRIIQEKVSGSTPAAARLEFIKLLERLDEADTLVCTKLDRLGRDAIDVVSTIDRLQRLGVSVHCLQLPGTDLTSTSGRMVLTVLCAVAQFERDLIIERTHAGIVRAKAQGKRLGRPVALSAPQKAKARALLTGNASISAVARQIGCSRATVTRASQSASKPESQRL